MNGWHKYNKQVPIWFAQREGWGPYGWLIAARGPSAKNSGLYIFQQLACHIYTASVGMGTGEWVTASVSNEGWYKALLYLLSRFSISHQLPYYGTNLHAIGWWRRSCSEFGPSRAQIISMIPVGSIVVHTFRKNIDLKRSPG